MSTINTRDGGTLTTDINDDGKVTIMLEDDLDDMTVTLRQEEGARVTGYMWQATHRMHRNQEIIGAELLDGGRILITSHNGDLILEVEAHFRSQTCVVTPEELDAFISLIILNIDSLDEAAK